MFPLAETLRAVHGGAVAVTHVEGVDVALLTSDDRDQIMLSRRKGSPGYTLTVENVATTDLLGGYLWSDFTDDQAAAALNAWAAHTDRAARYRALAAQVNSTGARSDHGRTRAQDLFSRAASWYPPTRSDGRYEASGYIEAYPGAWPRDAVDAWSVHGDLSALWPYLPARRADAVRGCPVAARAERAEPPGA